MIWRRWADNIKVDHNHNHRQQQFISRFMACFIFLDVGISIYSLFVLHFFYRLECIRILR